MQVFLATNPDDIQTLAESVCFYCLRWDVSFVEHSVV